MSKLHVPNRNGGFDVREQSEDLAAALAHCQQLESALRISQRWRERTFVPPEPPGTAFDLLHEEFEEFSENPSAGEAADVLILLHAWACDNGVDLLAAVSAKIRRNLAADFTRREDGTWRRVKTP